ncbi:hypothetical protein GCM10027190_30010 [Spirosoma areae]
MVAERWNVGPKTVQFVTYKSIPALKILPPGKAVLTDVVFKNGTIEYDIAPESPPFTGIYFRRQSNEEAEYFYLRVGRAENPMALDAIQYAPVIKGVNLWDLLPACQGPALFKRGEWNHVKLVVSGRQMRVYVNDMAQPTLDVPQLEGNSTEGGLAFDGAAIIANLVIKPDDVAGLSPTEGLDPTRHDPRYLRKWAVSQPMPLPKGRELTTDDFPKPETAWQPLEAERLGLVNLTRLFGKSESRRMIWLAMKLRAGAEQKRRVALGFSDEVWVFVNGQLAYTDKNLYRQPIMKEPEGRCSLENSHFILPLKAGENELLIGVANDFFGWGIIARLDTMEGIGVE